MLRDPSLIPLSHQHHNGLALCVLTRRDLRRDSSDGNVNALARRIIDRYDLELVNHFELEEQILFPGVQAQIGELPIIAELIAQHRQLEARVEELKVSSDISRLQQFCDLLTAHIRREENELFPLIQQRMPPQVLEHLGLKIDERVVRICF